VLVNAALGTRALRGLVLSVPLLAASLFIGAPAANAASPAPVNLGTADPFAILAGTPNITNVPPSVITGNVGLSPASAATSTVACSDLTGTSKFYSVTSAGGAAGPPCQVVDPVLLTGAKGDLTNAFTDVMNRVVTNTVPTELGGHTYAPGVYDSSSTTFGITAGAGPLILDAQGNPNAVFIFEMNSGSTGLTVGPASQVQLTGSAQACNVFWRVTTASIDTTAVFKGTILALTSITVNKGANIEGRLLARNGTVTLIQDTITRSACAAPAAPAAPPVLAPPLFTG
jgi:hypothetical protein